MKNLDPKLLALLKALAAARKVFPAAATLAAKQGNFT